METKTNFRARVMKYAHQIRISCKKTWSESLKMAWQVYFLYKRMRKGMVQFIYRKVDGSIRVATGTMMNYSSTASKRITKPSYKTFAYYDVDKGDMRCFKIENLLLVL
jgi:hypothetical protein